MRDPSQNLSRGIINPVITPQIAGIIIGDDLVNPFRKRDLGVPKELPDQFRTVENFEIPTPGRIFIFERLQAMGTMGDNFFYPMGLQDFDILKEIPYYKCKFSNDQNGFLTTPSFAILVIRNSLAF